MNYRPEGCYVVLHMGLGPSDAEEKGGSSLVVTDTNRRFSLSDEIWIERLDERLAKHIQRACEPADYKVVTCEPDRHLYAFLRRVSNAEKSKYDGMEDLHTATALSRLIHPTSLGDHYSALVLQFGLEDSAIKAIQSRGISPDVFVIRRERDWLSVEDGESLRKLMPWLSKDKRMHERVRRAYWSHECAMRSIYLDIRWLLVVSGLEALMNVGNRDLKWQFRGRVRQLADEFGIGLSDDDLSNAWDLRSKITHAESFLYGLETVLPKSQHNSLYEKLEGLLRMTVRRCLLEENFGSFFSGDHAVEEHWPLDPKPKNPKK